MVTVPSIQNVDELVEIIKTRIEREWIDFKDWVDLTEKAQKAKIAADICGLSNFGGGYLIFGISETGENKEYSGEVRKLFSQDTIAGIVHKYLDVKIPCEVRFVIDPNTNIEHPILWVPPVAPDIVYSKCDGPGNEKGKPIGICNNTAYTRSPKPETVPINSRILMAPVIQRCMLAKRDELLGQIGQILSISSKSQDQSKQERRRLEQFHTAMQSVYKEAGAKYKTEPPIHKNFAQYSYELIGCDHKAICSSDLMSYLEQANRAVKDTVHYGWSMFHLFTRQSIAPSFIDENGKEFLQAKLFDNGEDFTPSNAELWRVSPTGLASLIRPFGEDFYPEDQKPRDTGTNTRIQSGKWLSPYWRIRDFVEIIRHARAMAELVDAVEKIKFRIEWVGINGRKFEEPPSLWDYGSHSFSPTSQSNGKVLETEFSVAEIISNLPRVTSELFNPFARLFNPKDSYSPKDITPFLLSFRRFT
jgi:hypothetical protein